jgi:hypothetical protein
MMIQERDPLDDWLDIAELARDHQPPTLAVHDHAFASRFQARMALAILDLPAVHDNPHLALLR